MNYELAKELKDAGFPGLEDRFPGYEGGNAELDLAIKHQPFRGVPTLSELIEACGEGIHDLTRTDNGWLACSLYGTSDHETYGEGSSPEEAVANLWLALHENNTLS